MSSILIKNGTIMTHDTTIYDQDLLIENGYIKAMQSQMTPPDETCVVIDAKNQYILPGLVDMHCEICDPGYDYKEEFATVGAAAIAGGYTTITCNPMTEPIIDNKAVVEYVIGKAKEKCPVNVLVYGSMTKGGKNQEIAEIGEMMHAGICGISDGDLAIQDSYLMRNCLEYSKMFNLPIIVHNEDRSISHDSGVNEGVVSTQLGLVGALSVAETSMLARNILLAEALDVKVHVSHISTKRSVDLIKDAKHNHIKITAETSPQYIALDETEVLGFNSYTKMNPPLRSKEDVAAIRRAVAEGVIDVISSDHKPDTIDSNTVEFELASFGMPSLELSLSVAYTELVATGMMTMEALMTRMSFKPAQILNMCDGGKIAKGLPANLLVFNPGITYTVDSSLFKSKAKYSAFEGKSLKGLVTHTFVNGILYTPNESVCELYEKSEAPNGNSPIETVPE